MDAYQTDDNGYYIGIAVANPSPREPGVFSPPAGAVMTPPPALAADQRAQWVNDAWVIVEPDPVVPPPSPTLAEQKAAKLYALAAYRWDHEHGGFELPDSTPVDTSPRTRAFITAAYIKADKDANYQISAFKSGPGAFGTLTASQIIAIGDAIDDFVQACFSRESVLSSQIMAAADGVELAAIDIETGWPT